VWAADYEPFGKATITTNIIDSNTRFPGQYADEESGLHYNYFRDYDPETGRYIESDPIGLAGGLNTYAYVKVNPLRYTDQYGLQIAEGCAIGAAGGPAGCAVGAAIGAVLALGVATYCVVTAPDFSDNPNVLQEANDANGVGERSADSAKPKETRPGQSGKDAASDVPSWARGERPTTQESGRDFAKRLLDRKYGPGNYPKGPTSEFNKIQKWGDRGFINPK
jgi:RHS repeat-associated protein